MTRHSSTRREELIQTAAKLFREKGYAKTTVRDLAKAVGIQSGSLFHHFDSKEEILFEVMEEGCLVNLKRLENAYKRYKNSRRRIHAMIRADLEAILGETHDQLVVLFYEWRAVSRDKRAYLLNLRKKYETLWTQALSEAKEEGILMGDPVLMRKFLSGAFNWTINWYRPEGNLTLDDLAAEALNLVFKPEPAKGSKKK